MQSTSNTDQLSWRPRVLYDSRIADGFRLHAEHGPSPDEVAPVPIAFFEA